MNAGGRKGKGRERKCKDERKIKTKIAKTLSIQKRGRESLFHKTGGKALIGVFCCKRLKKNEGENKAIKELSLFFLVPFSASPFSHSKKPKNRRKRVVKTNFFLLERDEPRRRRRPDPGLAVLNGLVRDRELAQVVANHVGLDLDLVERLAVVDADDAADHLRDDDGVAEVGADGVGLLVVGGGGTLGGAELLDEGERLALEAALEAVEWKRSRSRGSGRGREEEGERVSDDDRRL